MLPFSSSLGFIQGAKVHVYDPVVKPQDISAIDERLVVEPSVVEASMHAHALVVCTEWAEFKSIDFGRVFQHMHKPAFVFDGRSVLDADQLESIGFQVHAIGRPGKQ